MCHLPLFFPGDGHGRPPGVDGIQQVGVQGLCVLKDAVGMVHKLLVSSAKFDFAHRCFYFYLSALGGAAHVLCVF